MEIDRYDDGVPCWIDLGTADPAKAGEFYSALFGWDVQPGPPEAGGYAIAHLRGRPVAGIGPQQNPGPPYWTTYVSVSDAESTAAAVKDNGGQVLVGPFDVMGQGLMAVFSDPVGAVISVWQPLAFPGALIVSEPGAYSWSELVTTDLDRSKEFYGAVFGWGADTHGEGPGAYTEWKVAGRSVGGMMLKPPMMPAQVPPHWGVYFTVADAGEAAGRVTELGGSVMMPPMEIEPGTFALVSDPQGAVFRVIALREQAS